MPTNSFESLQQGEQQYLCTTYARYPVALRKGSGSRLWDFAGNEYVDLLGGIAVVCLGHAHDELAELMAHQARQLVHVSNLFYQEEQVELAKTLLATAHLDKAFFCNSGAEANEAAIKLARRYQQRVKNKEAFEIITFSGCFHGRTLATVAATGQRKFQDGFSPIPQGFKQVLWEDIIALEQAVSTKTAGVLLEIIQGEGGIHPLSREFAAAVAELCRRKEILLIIDEVQTGLGRTGKWWAYQHFDLKPDIVSSAKGLANGLPMGALMTTNEVAQAFTAGSHATTFGGGPFVSAVALKVLQIIERDGLVQRAERLGAFARNRFEQVAASVPGMIRQVRGQGLMLGIDLAVPGKKIWEELLRRGFILNLTQETILRLLPALTIPQEDLEAFAVALEAVLRQEKQTGSVKM